MSPSRARTKFLSPLLGVAVLVASRGSAQVPPTSQRFELSGTSWQLVNAGEGGIVVPGDRSKYTITFGNDNRLSARIDCNRGNGSWKSTGPNQIEFGLLALTRAKCPPGSLHDRIVRQWPFVRSYTIRNGHLFLSLMDGGSYEFEPMVKLGTAARPGSQPGARPAPGAPSTATTARASLENTNWKLTQLGAAPITVAPQQQAPHFALDALTKRVTGSDGCNRLGGTYKLSDDRLSFSDMTTTMMACAEGVETERAFNEALKRARRWRIAGQRLELLDAAGSPLARFEAVRSK